MNPEKITGELDKAKAELSRILPQICETLFKLQQEGTTEQGRKMLRDDCDKVQAYGRSIGTLIDLSIDHVQEKRMDLFEDDLEKMESWQKDVKHYKLHDAFWSICKNISSVVSTVIKIRYSSDNQ